MSLKENWILEAVGTYNVLKGKLDFGSGSKLRIVIQSGLSFGCWLDFIRVLQAM